MFCKLSLLLSLKAGDVICPFLFLAEVITKSRIVLGIVDFLRLRDFEAFAFVVAGGVTFDSRHLTAEDVVLFHVLSDVDTETFYCAARHGTQAAPMGEMWLILPSLSHSQQLETEDKYLHLFFFIPKDHFLL